MSIHVKMENRYFCVFVQEKRKNRKKIRRLGLNCFLCFIGGLIQLPQIDIHIPIDHDS